MCALLEWKERPQIPQPKPSPLRRLSLLLFAPPAPIPGSGMLSMESLRMHQSLAAAEQRKIDQRDRTLQMAAKCKAAMRTPAFFKVLPPEIRCMIYDFAYGDGGVITVDLNREAPLNGEALKCAFDPIIGISKEWLNEAFDIFMRSKQIQFEKFDDIERLACRLPRTKRNLTSISWYQESVYSWPHTISTLYASAPNVKSLSVSMGHGEYFAVSRESVHKNRRIPESVADLRGLRSFNATIDMEASFRESSWIREAFENGSFHANVAHYLARVRELVTKPESRKKSVRSRSS